MATRSKQPTQLEKDAEEFGMAVRCGGWRLGLLVARNVEGGHQGKRTDLGTGAEVGKVSAAEFAKVANVGDRTVRYYLNAWQYAAKAGLVPPAEKVEFGDDEVDVDIDSIEVDDNPRTQWSHFYQLAKNPSEKPKKESKPADEPEAKDDDSDAIDEDFGLKAETLDPITEAERTEADTAIQRNQLLEILESVQSIQSRLVRVPGVLGENGVLANQIASAAMDLSTTAMSMAQVESKQDA